MSKRNIKAILRFFGGGDSCAENRASARRPSQRNPLACEVLEGRVVLSHWGLGGGMGEHLGAGGSLVGTLSTLGVVTSSQTELGEGLEIGQGHAGQGNSQLNADLTTLRNDLKTLAAKSGVTVADLSSLVTDSRALAQAGFRPDPTALQKAVSELATAVASGSDTTQAKTDFNALFVGSSVPQTAIDKAFNDLVQTIQDSHVTPTDLQTIAHDRQAIQNDLARLPQSGFGDLHSEHGGSLVNALGNVGVVTSSNTNQGDQFEEMHGEGGKNSSQLSTDLATLRNDLKTLAAKSGVTTADVNNLNADSQAIAQTGFRFNKTALQKALSELATAVSSGADTTQAKTDFNALFTGSSVPQTTIDKAFTDLVQTIQDSHVTPTDLQTIAHDRQVIQNDLATLSQGGLDNPLSGQVGGHRGGRHRFRASSRRGW